MSDIAKAIPANEISNGNIVIYPNTTISYNSDQSDIVEIADIDLYENRFDNRVYYFSVTCSHSHAGIIMVGWEYGTRCLDASGGGCGGDPTGFGPPHQTYFYGDETVVYEDNIWKYKNLSTVIAQSSDGPHYPWDALWNSPFEGIKWCVANQDRYY